MSVPVVPQKGEDFVLKVKIGATFTIVNDMDTYSSTSSRSATSRRVFGRSAPYSFGGNRDQGFSFSGLMNPGDPGQQELRDAEENDTPVTIQVTYDGVNGFEQEVKVTQRKHDAAVNDPQSYGFEFAANGPRVIAGAGPINL